MLNFVTLIEGVKSMNGVFKPKYSKTAKSLIFLCYLLVVGLVVGLVYAILSFNLSLIFALLIEIVALIYLLSISPYTQSANNYRIEFPYDNSLVGFKLFYKGNLVKIEYKVDHDGKIAFANDANKLSCISYQYGMKMSNFTKYKIINYFTKWLDDNDLMSSEITVTFEKL